MSDPDSGYPTPRDDYPDDNPIHPNDLTPVKERNLPTASTPYIGLSSRLSGDLFNSGLTPIRPTTSNECSTDEAKAFIKLIRQKKRNSSGNDQDQLSRIEEHVTEQSRTVETLEGQVNILKQEKDDLVDKLNRSHRVIAETSVNLDVNSVELEGANKRIQELSSDLANTKMEKVALDMEVAKLKEVINLREEHVSEVQKLNLKLTEEIESLKSAQKMLQDAKKVLDEERLQIAERERKMERESDVVRKQVELLQHERDNLLIEKGENNKTATENRKQEIRLFEENEELLRRINDYESRVDILSNELRMAKSREHDMRCAKERVESEVAIMLGEKSKIEDIKTKLITVSELNEKLQETLSDNNTTISDLKKTLSSQEDKLTKLYEDMEKLNRVNEDLKAMNEELVSTNIEQKTKISDLSAKIGVAEKDLITEKVNSDKFKSDHDSVVLEITKLKLKNTELNDKCARLAELESLNTKLSEEVVFLRQELGNTKPMEEHEVLETRLKMSYALNGTLEEEIAALKKRENEVQEGLTKIESMKFEIKSRETRIEQLEVDLESKKKEMHAVKEERDMMTVERVSLMNEFDAVREAHELEKAKLLEDISALNTRLVQLEALDGYPGQLSFDAMNRTVWDVVPKEVRGVLENLKKDSAEIRNIVDKMQKVTVEVTDKYGSMHSMVRELEGSSRPESQASIITTASTIANSHKIFDDLIRGLNNSNVKHLESGVLQIRQLVVKFLRLIAFSSDNMDETITQFLSDASRELENQLLNLRREIESAKLSAEQIAESRRNIEIDLADHRVHLAAAKEHARLLRKDVDDRDRRIEDLKMRLDRLNAEEKKLREENFDREQDINRRIEIQNEYLLEVEGLMSERQDAEIELKKREEALARALADIEDLHRKLILTDDDMAECTAKLSNQAVTIQQLESKVTNLERHLQHELKTKKYNQETMEMCLQMYEKEEEYVKRLRRRNAERQSIIDDLLSGKEVGEKIRRKLNRFLNEDKDDSAEDRKHHSAWTSLFRQRQVENVLKERTGRSGSSHSARAVKTSTPNETFTSLISK